MTKENETEYPILAICYDFDKTLSPDDMQAQGYIQSIDYEVDDFWRESNELSEENEMDRNLAYIFLNLPATFVPSIISFKPEDIM